MHFFYDRPVTRSGELAKRPGCAQKHSLPGDAATSPYVDRKLANSGDKVIATSDGPLMDKVKRVVDLPGLIRSKNLMPPRKK